MKVNPTQAKMYYQAMLARDNRFDGKFFVGVKTTGIYCRPICPARPQFKNVEFFKTAFAAEQKGYRPCLRCRPEGAPVGSGHSPLVIRALQLIASESGPLLQEADYAEQLGISARHLRRLFQAEFGRTPKQIAATLRLNFARKLVCETALPLTTVALSAGFRSLRRFNAAFKERFSRPPSDFRTAKMGSEAGRNSTSLITLSLPYRSPFDWAGIYRFFKRHALQGPEYFGENHYERVFSLKDQIGWLELHNLPNQASLQLSLMCPDPRILSLVVHRLRRMWDLDSDPLLLAQAFEGVPLLAGSYLKDTQLSNSGSPSGLRLPGAWDGFETTVAIILGQMVSLARARHLLAELIQLYGPSVLHPRTLNPVQIFPSPETLANAPELQLGTTRQRLHTIQNLARMVVSGQLSLSPAQDPQRFRAQLQKLPGIGPWTTEMIALRVLGDTDAFPANDLIIKRMLKAHPGLEIDKLKPWRAYAAIAIWEQAWVESSRESP
ncbi:MAG: DNA-3-methyladenine glycosylase 2 family protein [Candidatus Sericytochromatia bacterium]|nr:DNA-3-methyladenine glycosylase 2 family protein [Candidatus Sericytochromatia bacterium]